MYECMQYVFDYQPGDIFSCVAVLGWITGHSYVVYGPLCNGATTVLFESIASYPKKGIINAFKLLLRYLLLALLVYRSINIIST